MGLSLCLQALPSLRFSICFFAWPFVCSFVLMLVFSFVFPSWSAARVCVCVCVCVRPTVCFFVLASSVRNAVVAAVLFKLPATTETNCRQFYVDLRRHSRS